MEHSGNSWWHWPPGGYLDSFLYSEFSWFFNNHSSSFVFQGVLCPFCFPFLFIYIHSRLFFPFFPPFSVLLPSVPLILTVSSWAFDLPFFPPLVILTLPSSCSSFSGTWRIPGFRAIALPLSFQNRRQNLPLWQREQKLQVPAQVTRTAFSLFRGF